LWTNAGNFIYRDSPVIVGKTTRDESANGSLFEAGSLYAFSGGVFMKDMPSKGSGETQILYYNPTTGKIAVGAASGSLWTDAGDHTYLTSTEDNISIGKSTNSGDRFEVSGDCSASGTWTASNFILPSERKLKKDIKSLDDIQYIDLIEFKQFKFKDDADGRIRYGVIVDEIEHLAPNLIYDNNGKKTVSYIDLLIAKVSRLEQRFKKLENGS